MDKVVLDGDEEHALGGPGLLPDEDDARDLDVPGRDLEGIHQAMEFLPQQNRVVAGDTLKKQLRADGKGNIWAVNKSRGEDDDAGDRIWKISPKGD
mgnify:CR=1 FL=1